MEKVEYFCEEIFVKIILWDIYNFKMIKNKIFMEVWKMINVCMSELDFFMCLEWCIMVNKYECIYFKDDLLEKF